MRVVVERARALDRVVEVAQEAVLSGLGPGELVALALEGDPIAVSMLDPDADPDADADPGPGPDEDADVDVETDVESEVVGGAGVGGGRGLGVPVEVLSVLGPGAGLVAELEGLDLGVLEDYALVEVLAAARRVESWAAGVGARAAAVLSRAEVFDPARLGSVDPETMAVAEEIAMRLAVSRAEATKLIAVGRGLSGSFAATGAALAGGRIDFAKAAAIVTSLRGRPDAVAWLAEQEVLALAHRRPLRQVRQDLARAVIAVDAQDAVVAHRRANRSRHVTHPRPLPDGMASMYVVGAAQDLVEVDLVLDAVAAAAKADGDDRSRDQLRVDTLFTLTSGAIETGWVGPPPGTRGSTRGGGPGHGSAGGGDRADGVGGGGPAGPGARAPGTAGSARPVAGAGGGATPGPGFEGTPGPGREREGTGATRRRTLDPPPPDIALPSPGIDSPPPDIGTAELTAGRVPGEYQPARHSGDGHGEDPGDEHGGRDDDEAGEHGRGRGGEHGGGSGQRGGGGCGGVAAELGVLPDLVRRLRRRRGMRLGEARTNRTEVRVTIPLSVALPAPDVTEGATTGGAGAGTASNTAAGTTGAAGVAGAAGAGGAVGAGGAAGVGGSAADEQWWDGPEPSEVAELNGYGPITPDVARALAAGGVWRRIVTDPLSGAVLDVGRRRYRPPADLAAFVRERDRTCVRPGCSTPATRCQLDHTIPAAQGGPTSAANLGSMCERDHNIKSTGQAKVTQPRPGVFEWITPTGHGYRRDIDGTITPLPRSYLRTSTDPF